jgi:hypothetical protein
MADGRIRGGEPDRCFAAVGAQLKISEVMGYTGHAIDPPPGRHCRRPDTFPSYTQKLWIAMKKKAAYLPG